MYEFQLINADGEILETFTTAEHRWQTGDTRDRSRQPSVPRGVCDPD
jgi:hypothetical protein